jgi:hypothetical protein
MKLKGTSPLKALNSDDLNISKSKLKIFKLTRSNLFDCFIFIILFHNKNSYFQFLCFL